VPGRIACSSHGPWSPSGFYAKCVHGQRDAMNDRISAVLADLVE
jgi:hypothetical protein